MLDHDTPSWVNALREKVSVTPGFEKDIPPYVSEFLTQQLDGLEGAVLSDDKGQLMKILADFTNSIPRENLTSSFEELFLGVFFTPGGRPHLSIIKGKREKISSEDVRAADLDFPEAPVNTTGLILIHTHPKDSLVGLSDSDIEAFSGVFSQRLRLFPNLDNAYIGLCTASKPEKTLLFTTETWSGIKYSSKESLRKRP